MLRFGRMTDYGIDLMGQLAGPNAANSAPRNTRELADSAGLSVTTTAKILKQLQEDGLLMSTRGASGGYQLARPARKITLHDIVVAIEGPLTMSTGPSHITKVVCDALVSITLAELLARKEAQP